MDLCKLTPKSGDEYTKEIYARAPMASILSYVSDLRKITKGRGYNFWML